MASSHSVKPRQIFKLLSRSGKISRRYVHSWNVQDEQGTISSVDSQYDVPSFEVIPSEYPHTLMADEILTNEILLEDQSSVIHEAKLKELASWADRKVYDPVTNSGQPFITVRWVVTEKNINGQHVVKARLVAHGFQESQDFRKDSPTCTMEDIRLALSVIASKAWTLKSLDIKTALLQGQTIDRIVYVLSPPEAETECLWQLRKCICGLADAPRCFYLRLRDVLSKVQVLPSPLDDGLFFAHCRDTGDLIGIIACHVDDLLYGGTSDFQLNVIEKLRVALEFGTENTRAFTYIGMNVKQHPDKSITLDQVTFASGISQIELSQDCLTSEGASLIEEERTQFRAAAG